MTAPKLRSQASGESADAIVEIADAGEWNSFIAAADAASFCHLWQWREIIEDTAGHECIYRGMRDGAGALTAAMPLVRVRTRLFGDHLVSLPFLNYGGPVGPAREREALARWAVEQARALKVDSLLLRTRQQVGADVPTTSSKVTVVLPFPETADELWNKGFNSKFRTKIKRPQRDGMVTKFGPEHLDGFYDVWAENMRDLGTPALPRKFFQRIVAAFPELVLVGVTYWNDRPVAGGFGFLWRTEFEMTWSSSAKELRAAKPNMLLYWDYMRELIARGTRSFNFGRSTPGTGPHEFKQSWGGIDEPLPWVQWPETGGGAGESRAARLASTVWRRVPLGIANSLGPVLARQLPWW